MKKFLYTALMLLSSVAMVTSCGDDDDSAVLSQTPAADVQGTYNGQLTISYTDPSTQQPVVNTADATVVLSENGTYSVAIDLTSASDSRSGVANISTMSGSYPFCNKSTDAANTFGVFTGNVTDKVCTVNYEAESTVRVGGRPRKVTTSYVFTGVKEEDTTEDEAPASDAGAE